MRKTNLFLTMFAFILLMPLLAWASTVTPESYPIHLGEALQGLTEWVFAGIAAVLSALLGFAINAFRKKTGVEVDEKTRAYLEAALDRALDYARSRAGAAAAGVQDIHVKSLLVADAAEYAIKAVPQALEHFGIGQERLEQMLVARLQTKVGQ